VWYHLQQVEVEVQLISRHENSGLVHAPLELSRREPVRRVFVIHPTPKGVLILRVGGVAQVKEKGRYLRLLLDRQGGKFPL
jgi:hypothetical protein